MIPGYLRRSLSFSARAACAYLKGISERVVASVLEVVLGEGPKKLTLAVLSELKKSWTGQFNEWNRRDSKRPLGRSFTSVILRPKCGFPPSALQARFSNGRSFS
jgi:hypothetical protein